MEQPANKYPPNWVNYENEYASFQWDHVWDKLSGTSTIDKLNIACEAVDCHADGMQEALSTGLKKREVPSSIRKAFRTGFTAQPEIIVEIIKKMGGLHG
ncbi:hypothetical protein [Fodinibius sp. SL11]|uniref:hypothetical protein n=1 Tax=Fodinibius sp. SL11 TaxID=3425690 RepID=UPI003F88587F